MRARVSINAKPADVFRVLTNFDSYDQWNPWLKGVRGDAIEGQVVMVRPNMISLFGMKLRYRLKRIQPYDFLHWEEEAWFHFLFYTVREYQVYTKASGAALYSVGLTFYGPLADIVGLFYRKTVWRGLKREAEALRDYCEAHYALPTAERYLKK